MATKTDTKVVASNKKAGRDYFLLEKLEGGLVLLGSEVKSVRAGQVSLAEAYIKDEKGEMWLVNAHIATYNPASRANHDPLRPRKVLLRRAQIERLHEQAQQKGLTIIPTQIYLKGGRAKIEVALARGKKHFDKRQAMAERDSKRDIERALKNRE